jgi:metallo-beta-lactamase family protein
VSNLSAHADYAEILAWLGGFEGAPKTTFITHGEPVATDAMRLHIDEELKWKRVVPDYLDNGDFRLIFLQHIVKK